MRKIMKRGFCLFLVAVLLAGLVPNVFADETEATQATEAVTATEPSEETTVPTETTEATKGTEPTETAAPTTEPKPTEATEATESGKTQEEPPEDDAEDDRLLSGSISTYASTVSNVLLFGTRKVSHHGSPHREAPSLPRPPSPDSLRFWLSQHCAPLYTASFNLIQEGAYLSSPVFDFDTKYRAFL